MFHNICPLSLGSNYIFLTKGLCWPLIKDDERVSRERAKCEAVLDLGIEF